MKTSKIPMIMFIVVSLFLCGIFLLFTYAEGESSSDVQINQYLAEIEITEEGSMIVEEIWTITYPKGYSTRFRDIVYQKFPYDYPLERSIYNNATFDIESADVTIKKDALDITDQFQIGYSFENDFDELGKRVTCPDGLPDQCESIFLHRNTGLDGVYEFIYQYTIDGVVSEYSDISEINWKLFEYAESGVPKGEVNITFPKEVTDYDIYLPNIRESEISRVDNKNITISFTNMKKEDSLAFRILVPTTTFDSIQSANIFIDEGINRQIIQDFENDQETGRINNENYQMYTLYLSVGTALFTLLLFPLLKKRYFSTPVVTVSKQVSPPTDHSPAVVAYLYSFGKFTQEYVSATLLDLINRGYIELDDDNYFAYSNYYNDVNKNTKEKVSFLLNTKKDLSELKQHEQHLIRWYFEEIGKDNTVNTYDFDNIDNSSSKSSQFTLSARKFERLVKDESKKVEFYSPKVHTARKKASKFLILPIITFVLLLAVMIFVPGVKILFIQSLLVVLAFFYLRYEISQVKMLSLEGANFLAAWTSYKENLYHLDVVNVDKVSDIEFYDNALTYATAFGMTEHIIEQLKTRFPKSEPTTDSFTYRSRQLTYRQYYYSRGYMYRYHRRRHHRVVRSIQARRAKSYSSRSGGFGGGGSFGGGGGGGRSR